MHEFTPWLGLCHIRKEADDARSSQQTLVAAWADSVEGFAREVHFHTNTHGLQMILAEEVLPATEWIQKHPDRKDAQRLAAKVSAKHPVEIGTLGAGASGTGSQPDDTGGYLYIEEIEGVEPLDSQFGVHPPKTVPDALYEPLFGQPDPTPAEVANYGGADKVPPLHTYAILDAAKVVNFVEMLEASGLEYRCLFKGDAAEEMRDVAPYVVRLEEDVDFTRNLFSHDPEQEVPWFMWDREPGIYVRSRGSLEEMWRHFRKFTKVQDEDGKWFYFRFWEPRVLLTLITLRRPDHTITSLLMGIRNSCASLTVFAPNLASSNVIRVMVEADVMGTVVPLRPIVTSHDVSLLKDVKLQRDIDELDRRIANKLSAHLPHLSSKDRRQVIESAIQKFMGFGFRQKKYLLQFCVWSLFFGHDLEVLDPTGKLNDICRDQLDEHRRFEAFENRIREIQGTRDQNSRNTA